MAKSVDPDETAHYTFCKGICIGLQSWKSNSCFEQKNPTAVRTAEEDRGLEKHTLDLLVNLDQSHTLSHHIYNICQDSVQSVYAKESDIKILSQGNFTFSIL